LHRLQQAARVDLTAAADWIRCPIDEGNPMSYRKRSPSPEGGHLRSGMTMFALVRRVFVAGRAPLSAGLLLAAVFTLCIGVGRRPRRWADRRVRRAGKRSRPRFRRGPDGNLWFQRPKWCSRAGPGHSPNGDGHRFTSGLNPAAPVRSITMGSDGNMWFSDPGTTRAIGVIDPFTQVINEFSAGLNAAACRSGSAAGPDGNVWFTDNGTPRRSE
jgi:hypothetical protein